MTSLSPSPLPQPLTASTGEPPPWVEGWVGPLADVAWSDDGDDLSLRVVEGREHALVSVRLARVRELPAFTFQRRTADVYERIGRRLRTSRSRHPVRLWNFIPGILEPLGELPHRYMVFNAGRFAAYQRWYRHRDRFDRYVATASGVGWSGDDLVVHCLAARAAGAPVENPRQVAAYQYSARYGPLPPCFARATRVGRRPGQTLLVGGTAAVRGEDSLYPGDLAGQLAETFRNLAAVVAAGRGGEGAGEATQAELDRYRSLRVYWVREEDLPAIRAALAATFPGLETLEMLPAAVCRPELLVEIEGVADVGPLVATAAATAASRPPLSVV